MSKSRKKDEKENPYAGLKAAGKKMMQQGQGTQSMGARTPPMKSKRGK